MAVKNIDVFIKRPALKEVEKYVLTSYLANDEVKIPRRTPFTNIKNLTDLKADGFFRTETTEVSTEYGGSNVKDAFTNLGYTLPRTEKLILLAKRKAETAVTITFSGNARAGFQPKVITLPAGVAGDIYEIDLYDLGIIIESNREGNARLTLSGALDLLLIARH